jgi:2-hydroxycyclohexanecarboxyl-CoA dehydrogenase
MAETERMALVTGGGGGIGRAIALALAEAGRAVAVADVRGDEAERTAQAVSARGRRAMAVEIDVTNPDSVAAGIERAANGLAPVDIAVNGAGWDELRPFLETDEPFWERVLAVNFLGALRVTHAALPGMVQRGFGRIVNIGSDAGRVGSSHEAVYSGAKGGVIAFTKTIAREVALSGVTANTVCPGPTRTPMLEAMAAPDVSGGRLVEALRRAVPMRRLGEPEDVAAAVAFFASDAAGYVTGQTLSVSGGLTMA